MNTIAGELVGAGAEVVIGVRPEHLHVADHPADGLRGTVVVIESLGHEQHVVCHLADGSTVIVRQASSINAPAVGSSVTLTFAAADVHRFDAATGLRTTP